MPLNLGGSGEDKERRRERVKMIQCASEKPPTVNNSNPCLWIGKHPDFTVIYGCQETM